jgi:hypothetical protein
MLEKNGLIVVFMIWYNYGICYHFFKFGEWDHHGTLGTSNLALVSPFVFVSGIKVVHLSLIGCDFQLFSCMVMVEVGLSVAV